MNRRLRILNVEDNPNDTEFIRAMLEQETILTDILRVDSREQFISALQQQHFDLILSDYNLPGFDGLSALQVAKQFAPDVPFIYVSGTIGEERAIEALKNGATDYVIKDRLKRLPAVVRRALAERQERTERRRTEEELRKLFRAIEQSPSMVMITDASGNIEYVNPKLTETTGYSAREIIGQNPRILKSGKMPDEEYQRLWKTITAGGEWHGELYNRRKTGENYWVSASISAVRNLDGVITHFVAVQEDITTRRQAEEKIHQQAALLDIDPDAIYVKDTEDRIQFWSKGAERLYGYTREEVLGQRSADLTFMEAPVEYNQALQAVLQHGHWKGEWQQRTRDGRDIVVSSSWLLVRDTQGLPQSIYVVNSDITEKKKLETQFLRAQRMESIGTLAGGIAHDLNNVLGPIMIAVQLLRRKLPLPEDQKMLNMLETVTKRGADMVKHIITFARGVEGKTISIQPQHLLQEIEQMIRETFPKNIDFKMEFARDLWTISGDPTQINQVLLNLSVNARDAMPGGGELTLSVDNAVIDEQSARFHVDAKPGTYVVFTISDSGAGIPQHLLQKIFEPFFTTKEVGKGTGLGLSSSYGIVRSHGGFVSVYSEVGKGTQFKVYIPALPSPAAQRAAEAAPDLPAGNGETILVIDDETSILEITKSTLESFGYRVLTGADGAEGVVLCAKHAGEVRAVICDMNMPLMDGPATIRAVRKILPRVNIIAVSGFMKDEQAIELESGENIRFLPKPYSAEKLLTQLASILRS